MQLPATATIDEAAALMREVSAALESGSGAASIDAAALQSFDTSVVALLLHAGRLAQASGRPLQVVGAPAKLVQLAQLYGVDKLLSLSPEAAGSAGA